MHSAIGPTQEAQQIYIKPSGLAERLTQTGAPVILWDVGMGIAGNAAAVFELSGKRSIEVHSFENECVGIKTALEDIDRFPHLKPIESQVHSLLKDRHALVGKHSWRLYPGDFRQLLTTAPPADLIFFDFYSPRVCGSLWSVPVMQAIRNHCPRSTLVTYSAATPIRLALFLAGWCVGRSAAGSPVTALKNESTIAVASARDLHQLVAPFGKEWLNKFRSSSQSRPYPAESTDAWSQATFEELEAQLLRHPQLSDLAKN
jgi:hypothetical protein